MPADSGRCEFGVAGAVPNAAHMEGMTDYDSVPQAYRPAAQSIRSLAVGLGGSANVSTDPHGDLTWQTHGLNETATRELDRFALRARASCRSVCMEHGRKRMLLTRRCPTCVFPDLRLAATATVRTASATTRTGIRTVQYAFEGMRLRDSSLPIDDVS